MFNSRSLPPRLAIDWAEQVLRVDFVLDALVPGDAQSSQQEGYYNEISGMPADDFADFVENLCQ